MILKNLPRCVRPAWIRLGLVLFKCCYRDFCEFYFLTHSCGANELDCIKLYFNHLSRKFAAQPVSLPGAAPPGFLPQRSRDGQSARPSWRMGLQHDTTWLVWTTYLDNLNSCAAALEVRAH